MKVSINEHTKRAICAALLPAAKSIVEQEKEDDFRASDYAEMAATLLCDENIYPKQILSASAYVMPNRRVWEQWGEGTENLDVWVDFIAEKHNGFIKGGAYISDIWQIGGTDRDELASRMYCLFANYEE